MKKQTRRSVAKLLLIAFSIGVLEGHVQSDVQQSLAAGKITLTLNKKKLTLKKGKLINWRRKRHRQRRNFHGNHPGQKQYR